MQRYSILRFEKERDPVSNRLVCVAIVHDEQNPEYPFRIVVENFKNVTESKRQILNWMEQKEAEDEAAKKAQPEEPDELNLEALNNSL